MTPCSRTMMGMARRSEDGMDQKIEAVARALCKFDGRDPDQKTREPGGGVGFRASLGAGSGEGPPLWDAYRAEAERFVVAATALGPLLEAPEVKRW